MNRQPLDNCPSEIAPSVFAVLRQVQRTPQAILELPLALPKNIHDAIAWLRYAEWVAAGVFNGASGADCIMVWIPGDPRNEGVIA